MEFRFLEDKKYSLSEHSIEFEGRRLYQIYSSIYLDIGDGFILTRRGGYIESEDNLSHDGECWIDDGCYVYGNARIEGDALITCEDKDNPTVVRGRVTVKDKAKVISSIVQGLKTIKGNTVMSWNTVQKG